MISRFLIKYVQLHFYWKINPTSYSYNAKTREETCVENIFQLIYSFNYAANLEKVISCNNV